jgi:hypothetical protein
VFAKDRSNLSFSEAIFLSVLGSVLVSGSVALALAEMGLFSLTFLVAILLIYCFLVVLKGGREFKVIPLQRPVLSSTTFIMIGILGLSLFLFFRPYPWILGGRDPGVYVNTGVNIAKTGSIVIHDRLLASVNESVKNILYYFERDPELLSRIKYQGVQFPGFYITNKDIGEVTPQFFYLWPTWIAVFYSVFGLRGALFVTPFFAWLATFGVYLFAKVMLGKNVGVIACLLLGVNFAQIWYARYPTTEVFTQFLLFSGLATFVVFNRTASKYFGVVSAMCFGEALLTRIDAVLMLVPFVGYFCFLKLRNDIAVAHRYFMIALASLAIHSIITAVFISTPYVFDVLRVHFRSLIETGGNGLLTLARLSIFLVAVAIIASRAKSRIIPRVDLFKRSFSSYARYTIVLAMLSLAFHAYFVWPTGPITSNSHNLVKLSWYLGGFYGIFLAILGSAALLYKRPFFESNFFLGILFVHAAFFLMEANITPDQPWWARRFIPVVIPSLIIASSYLIDRIGAIKTIIGRVRIGKLISTTLLILLVCSFAKTSYLLINHVEFSGAIEDVTQIADYIDKDGIVIPQRGPFGTYGFYPDYVSTPLKYIYDRETLYAVTTNHGVVAQIREWTSRGRRVYVLDMSEDLSFDLSPFYEFVLLASVRTEWPRLDQAIDTGEYGRFPERIIMLDHTYRIYELKPRSTLATIARVDLGHEDLGLVKGFYSAELSGNMDLRWTKEVAKVRFLIPEDRPLQKIHLRMAGYRPNGVPLANVSLAVNGQPVAKDFSVSNEMRTYEFNVPGGIYGPEIILEIQASTWAPAGTTRVGIIVDWILVEW